MTEVARKTNEKVELLLEALESGEYPRASGALFDGWGYCCLGVADRVCFNAVFTYDEPERQYLDDKNNHEYLDTFRARELGLDKRLTEDENGYLTGMGLHLYFGLYMNRQQALARMNDAGYGFGQIAHVIRELGWHYEE